MNIMRPEIMELEGRRYRINPILHSSEDDAYDQEDYQPSCSSYDPDEPYDEFDVVLIENGKYRTTFHVAQVFFSCIIGMKGNTRKRIQNETKTEIHVPKVGQKGNIVIVGQDRRGVCAARRRINLIVMGSRMQKTFTHFLSIPMTSNTIPMASNSIKKNFIKFKEEVLENCRNRGVDNTIFQTPEKLHLTLTVMVLADNEERKSAIQVLNDCKTAVIEPLLLDKVLKVRMAGLEFMNDDPREVDVLYGKVQAVDGSNILQELADSIVNFFAIHGGFVPKENNSVKLHCTLMNTVFREDKREENDQGTSWYKQKQKESFDASEILQRYGDYVFGEIVVGNIHLSQRYTKSDSGYYQPTAVLKLY